MERALCASLGRCSRMIEAAIVRGSSAVVVSLSDMGASGVEGSDGIAMLELPVVGQCASDG